MTIIFKTVSNPQYNSLGLIELTVTTETINTPFQFFASPNDIESHGAEIYNDVIAGKYGEIKPYTSSNISLVDIQNNQCKKMDEAYKLSIQQPIDYKSIAGIEQTYQSDDSSQDNLVKMLTGCLAIGNIIPGLFWVALDNTRVPFTLDDLKGLSVAMLTRGLLNFSKLQDKKTAIRNSLNVSDVLNINW